MSLIRSLLWALRPPTPLPPTPLRVLMTLQKLDCRIECTNPAERELPSYTHACRQADITYTTGCIYIYTYIHTSDIHTYMHTYKMHANINTYSLALQYITLHYTTVHYATVHYGTFTLLCYIAYITLMTYTCTYVHKYLHKYIPTYIEGRERGGGV